MEMVVFTFNPFSENSYIVYDETRECVIIDPGCYDDQEWQAFKGFITEQELKPVHLLNTHCHIDHVFGNHLVAEEYGLELEAHKEEEQVLKFAAGSANLYGLDFTPSPPITKYLSPDDQVTFGNTTLDMVFTPGHSPGSISFLHRESQTAIVGDVLFRDSIGRTDLPGGDHETLLESIRTQLYTLGDEWKVFNGHGPSTTIGYERQNNPFVRS
jgi:glyoxylase-like metal-dependent hydrolase (beta-lactamase superfamily II)